MNENDAIATEPGATFEPPDTSWPFFDDEHRALASSLAALEGDLPKLRDEKTAIPALAARGLTKLLVPSGGTSSEGSAAAKRARPSVRSLCLVREALGWLEPLADSMFAVDGLGSHPLAIARAQAERDDDAAWMDAVLGEVRKGTRVAAFALTERDAGSDIASLKTAAIRKLGGSGKEWRLDGEKIFISNAGVADHYVVFANADPARGKKGISAFFVEANARGLSIEKMPVSVDHPLGRLRFEGTPARLVGEIGEGQRLALGTLGTFRTTVGAAACGMAKRAFDEALAHSKRRVQFGQPLSEFQLTQAALAEMATELDAARLLVYRAAWKVDRGSRGTVEVAMAKLHATEAAQRIVDRAVQLLGGLGVVRGGVVERLYREVRPLRIYEGTTEIQKLVIGGALVRGRDGSEGPK